MYSRSPRALFVESFSPDGVACRLFDPGPPHPQQVRVAMRAAGISFADTLIVGGAYQARPELPFIPGTEAAGVVEALGDAVEGLAIGDRVVAEAWGGLFADRANVPAASLRQIPVGLTFEEAAALPASYLTAWHALVDRAQLMSGESLLVLGASGGTGYAAVQIGRFLGAHVIASASSARKRALAVSGGAHFAVDSGSGTWREEVKAANGGRSLDVVFDPVGGAATEPAFRNLAWRGRHLVIGFPAGIAALRTNLLLLKGASLIGVDVRQFGLYEPAKAAAARDEILALAGHGILRPVVSGCYPLEAFRTAFCDAASGRHAGRLVFTMPEVA